MTRHTWLGVGLVLLAVAGGGFLRFWGIGFGLPHHYHIDEPMWVTYGGKLCSGETDFPPHSGGPNLIHVALCAQYAGMYAGGLLLGSWESPSEFRAFYEADSSLFFLLGRSMTALAGTATLLATYLLARSLWSQRIGILAALLLAFSYLHVRESHFLTTDVPATFLLTVCLFWCARILHDFRLSLVGLATLFLGLATGIKMTIAVAAIPVFIALGLSCREGSTGSPYLQRLGRALLVALVCGVVGYVAGYPFLLRVFVDPAGVVEGVQGLAQDAAAHSAVWNIAGGSGWAFYLSALFKGLGTPLTLIAIAGVGLGLWKRSKADYLLLSFGLPFFFFLGSRGYVTAHYILPLLPILAILGARLIEELTGNRLGIKTGLVTLVLIPSIISTVRFNLLLEEEDTRTLAREWIEENVPEGSRIATSMFTAWEPPLESDMNGLPPGTKGYRVEPMGGLAGLSDREFTEYEGFDYVVVSGFANQIPLREERRIEARKRFFSQLQSQGELVKVIRPSEGPAPPYEYDRVYGPWTHLHSLERPGPSISIYRLPAHLSSVRRPTTLRRGETAAAHVGSHRQEPGRV